MHARRKHLYTECLSRIQFVFKLSGRMLFLWLKIVNIRETLRIPSDLDGFDQRYIVAITDLSSAIILLWFLSTIKITFSRLDVTFTLWIEFSRIMYFMRTYVQFFSYFDVHIIIMLVIRVARYCNFFFVFNCLTVYVCFWLCLLLLLKKKKKCHVIVTKFRQHWQLFTRHLVA